MQRCWKPLSEMGRGSLGTSVRPRTPIPLPRTPMPLVRIPMLLDLTPMELLLEFRADPWPIMVDLWRDPHTHTHTHTQKHRATQTHTHTHTHIHTHWVNSMHTMHSTLAWARLQFVYSHKGTSNTKQQSNGPVLKKKVWNNQSEDN